MWQILNDISNPLVQSSYRDTQKDLLSYNKVEKITEDLLQIAKTFKNNKIINCG